MSTKPTPPAFHPKPSETAIPIERDSDEGRRPDLRGRSLLLNRLGLGGLQDMTIERAAPWLVIFLALGAIAWGGGYTLSHSQWGWGSCPHRHTLDTMLRLQAPPPAPAPGTSPAPRPR